MAHETLLLEQRDDGVLVVTLNRPEARNGIDDVLRDELHTALLAADADLAVRAILLRAAGDDYCVGADLSATAGDAPTTPLEYRAPMRPYQQLFEALWDLETPVVSAVRGRVAGIGWLMALLADLVVAADDSRWTHVFLRRGMAPHAGDPYFLTKLLPLHVINEIAMLGDTVSSADLARWGAINRVVAASEVDKTADELAVRLGAGPTLSLGQAKRLYRRALDSDRATALAEESAATAMLSQTEDRVEGVAALFEGRRPTFKGR